jgi:uncharacterized membrane protein YtjA (UPF0391 family)
LIGGFDRFYPAASSGRFWQPACDFVPPDLQIFRVSRPGTISCGPDYFCRLRRGRWSRRLKQRGRVMLSWVVTFLVVALIAGILGFGGIAGVSIEIAKAIFFIAIILFLVSAVVGLARGRTRV